IPRMTSRTSSGMSTHVLVLTSPEMWTWPVVIIVSTATRLSGSSLSMASRTASLIWSAILSGCPSVTDSDVNKRRDMGLPGAVLGAGRAVDNGGSLSVEGREPRHHEVPHDVAQRVLAAKRHIGRAAVRAEDHRGVVRGVECAPLADLVDDQQVTPFGGELGPAVGQRILGLGSEADHDLPGTSPIGGNLR